MSLFVAEKTVPYALSACPLSVRPKRTGSAAVEN